jgi:glycosyltransferase involved in cell wall biosynthesis
MKILLVHNNKMRWADVFRAEELKKHLTDDEIDITDRWHLPNGDDYDVIHFLYSGGITKSKDYILKNKDKVFTTLASQRTLDFLFDDKKTLREIYQNTVWCVAQNKSLMQKMKDFTGKGNVSYIPNGVDTELFKREFVVGHVGAKDSAQHKGFHIVEEACKNLGLRLERAIEWNYTHEQMPDFYNKIDCLVLPSLSEGCNNPTLEALAMNKIVITTDVGIAQELEGVIIVERNIEAIQSALRAVSGRIQILEKYTWGEIAKEYQNVWNTCLQKKGQ